MPWLCKACDEEVDTDILECPICAAPKTAWTLVAEQTRLFRLSTRSFQPKRGLGHETCPQDEPPWETDPVVDAESVLLLTKERARALAADGLLPPSRNVLRVRLFPRDDSDWGVDLSVEYEAAAVEELEFPREADEELEPDGFVDVLFLFVCGEGSGEELEFPDLHVVDLSEESELGYAPTIEVSALRRPPAELPVELESVYFFFSF